ncbi:hypothetical protein BX600DRAFT_69427 [Xylariales sp. PMI_506]|nr:hypothetical protein BX600DRAFT_69427 [Xylariales sp. PMI_506]
MNGSRSSQSAPPLSQHSIQAGGTSGGTSTAHAGPEIQPYLKALETLQHAFPAMKSFLPKMKNHDAGRKLVYDFYQHRQNRVPGRCVGLQFSDDSVSLLSEPRGFGSPEKLRSYFQKNPAAKSRNNGVRRLFILEDMEPDYVDALGHYLGVDPLVFSEQMNTWNFTDSGSIPHRGLPSMCQPHQSFSLRYYEIRTLEQARSVDPLRVQMTFAVNRRKYERWRDIDLPSFADARDKRHAFVRRCASFWTSQSQNTTNTIAAYGWDAVLLVDPGMEIVDLEPKLSLILQDPTVYKDRASLWGAPTWETPESVRAIQHNSRSYHDGCPTLAPLLFSQASTGAQHEIAKFQTHRDLACPFDELVFYWTKVASKELIQETNQQSSNTSYYLLKHIAQHWTNQLELINCTVAKGEYFSDDYQAKIDDTLTWSQWKIDLLNVTNITKDINYMRRQMNHFWRAMVLNLDRIGIQLGCEQVDEKLPLALRGAQKDFLTLNSRLRPLHARVESLGSIANDLANLRAAFKGIYDGEFGLRLSLFASIVFPLTLIASIMSMGDDFSPGKQRFWIFWAASIPFVILFAVLLVYGKRPDMAIRDLGHLMGVRPVHRSTMFHSKQDSRNKHRQRSW